ncbi:putative 1-phosphatidylinositol-3-phosphate 5-kinase FAB1C [Zingiber officinale]|uniref:putative 1-phosphatidylinositol-3-phosphate 5-kinase FAB1C n=1 Tax=Zingiber officinale TaxID=94328 RepID=UPI001C4C4C46|nr:putative 1-phosphatidylinositol-3-phosphate 5-kinase FAB1C [Zingiber officinale]
MGVANYPILDLILKVRSWASIVPDVLSESLMSSVGVLVACSECREYLSPGSSYRCRGCGRLLCRKCMLSAASTSDRAEQQMCLCNLCFPVDNGPWEAAQPHDIPITETSPFTSPKSPLSRSSTDRLSQLVELRRLSSPRLLHCSTYKSYNDHQGEDEGKQFFTPMSIFSQEFSDIDSMSISAGNELCSFKSANSSPFDSPCRSIEQGLASSLLEQTVLFSQGSPHQFSKHRVDAEDLLENANDDSISENVMIDDDQDSQKAAEHCDFENDKIFYPPIPEDEQDDDETNFFGYIDEDDDVDESSKFFRTSSFSSDSFHNREKSNESHKEALKNVHAHFSALVSQLLKGEGVCAGSDQKGLDWLEIISSLAWQAANFVKPDTSRGGSMDPGDYVKVKCIASGRPSDSILVKGVVCTKNVKHKRMLALHKNPRLLLLGGSLEYQKAPNELASIVSVLEKETNYMNTMLSKIEALRPNVLLVEKSASSYAQEYLLERKEVSLVLNVKKPLLERISKCTGAQIVPSVNGLSSATLGHCEMFRIEKVYEEFSSTKQAKKPCKTLMFFEGCPRRLGCTVLLRGACLEELKKLKHVIQYASFAAYHLSLETSFLADEGASLPKFPIVPSIELPKKLIEADQFHSTVSSVTSPDKTVGNNHQNDRSGIKLDIERLNLSLDIIHSHEELLENISDPQKSNSLFELTSISDMNEFSNQRGTAFKSSPYVFICGPETGFSFKEPTCISPLSIHPSNHQGAMLEQSVKERSKDSNDRLLMPEDGHNKSDIALENEVPGNYFSTADNHQSILVSLSSTCIRKSQVCERSQLFRIKFYGSFDKPLGRYLRDDLFDETYCCPSCKEPTESHVRCYTHQHGSLTIMVRRLPSVKLPGEHDGRIWMWHRCLKCKRDEDGVPPAARRVIMSDAAWGLSFGKFLELSFSSHATANRVASCGHSLQRDCLRFYGFGNMVAFFHYSPVDILSVCLPLSVLDFNCHVEQKWLKEEADLVSNKINILHDKISDVLHTIERKVTTFENEPLKASIQRHANKLKDLLIEERHDYDVLLQQVAFGNTQPPQEMLDILELNRLRRALLLDSYVWDRRLYSLDSLSKEKNCTVTGLPLVNFPSRSNMSDLREEISLTDESFSSLPGETAAKSPFSGTIEKSSFQKKKNEDLSLEIFDCNTNNMVEMDLSIEGYLGSAGFNFVSSQFEDDTPVFGDNGSTVLENSTLPTSSLSDKIDLAWSGSGQPLMDGPKDCSEVDKSGFLKDTPSYRRVNSPLRVHSFDSALKFRRRVIGGFLPASLHLSSVRSFDSSRGLSSMANNPLISMRRAYSQSSPVPRLDNFLNRTPMHISPIMDKMTAGARLLLPQSALDNIVIAVYDDEPSSIISYAMTSQQYGDYITSCLDEIENFSMSKTSSFGNHHSNHADGTGLLPHQAVLGSEEPKVSRVLDSKETHFRVSFDDEYSIPSDKANFSVTCYFTKQFHALRKLCCPSELDYIRSLSRCKRWSAQGGKSNVYFAKSLDERFIIKQITKTELDSFEDFASEYFKYSTEAITSGSPTSLAKVLGIYQVSVKHSKGGREMKIDVMVMENLFFNRSISRIYDLKGSVRSRYNPDTTGNNTVLLDLNLLEMKPIFIGSKAKRRLERAVWNDTSFLASIYVMDYSLLAGIDETKNELVIGIIDYMRQYTWDKQLETWVKASGILGGPKNATPTVISPLQYKKRFRKAMSNYFLTVPDQWSS